jgi:SAM-dependent methyltransferase
VKQTPASMSRFAARRRSRIETMTDRAAALKSDVATYLASREPLYRVRSPYYQVTMIEQLASLWRHGSRRLLDVGSGTGLIAQCIADHFPVAHVHAVDVTDRFRNDLTIARSVFDGASLRFADGDFDCATMFNVLHHVAPAARIPLLREIRRVVAKGPVYIKDHLAANKSDHVRLAILDVLGNVPFAGMISASYLTEAEWQAIAHRSGYRIAERISGPFRSGLMETLFPNRLEIAMRLEPIA